MNTPYNTDIALYPLEEGTALHKALEECLPVDLETGHAYPFAKQGHRTYLPHVPVTLYEIRKDDVLFHDRALVEITDSHFELRDGKAYTAGVYVVQDLL